MKTLRDAFVADEVPNVVASSYVDVFGGEFSAHYLAKPYYVFYPYAHSPEMTDLSKEIARKYPEEKEIDWYNAQTTKRKGMYMILTKSDLVFLQNLNLTIPTRMIQCLYLKCQKRSWIGLRKMRNSLR